MGSSAITGSSAGTLTVRLALAVLVAAMLVAGCGSSDTSSTNATGTDREEPVAPPLQPGQFINLDLQGLQRLPATAHYALWIVSGDERVLAGRFKVGSERDNKNQPVALEKQPDPDTGKEQEVLASTSAPGTVVSLEGFEITVEPGQATDETSPQGPVLFAGDWAGAGERSEMDAVISSKGAAGSLILGTPTNPDDPDGTDGVWFLKTSTGGSAASLTLPDLPDGWRWEGFATSGTTSLTTGTFTEVDAADDEAPYSGTAPAPPFPGEDFLTDLPDGVEQPVDLADGSWTVSIGLRPMSDDSQIAAGEPFGWTVLSIDVPKGTADHEAVVMKPSKASNIPKVAVFA